jgi:hypothetical protein
MAKTRRGVTQVNPRGLLEQLVFLLSVKAGQPKLSEMVVKPRCCCCAPISGR